MENVGPTFIVAKVERDAGRVSADRSRTSGRPIENGSWTRCAAIPIIKAVAKADLNDATQEFFMKRFDCLKLLAPMVDEHMLTVTSLSSNTAFWSDLRREGASFFGCNMGLCIPFALGLTPPSPSARSSRSIPMAA